MAPIIPPYPPQDSMAKRLPQRLARWAAQLAGASIATGVDFYLLAAVMDRESNGENITGEDGHGQGLLQVDDEAHPSFCGANFLGEPVVKTPAFNVLAGALLLRSNLDYFNGDPLPAVGAYNASRLRVSQAVEAAAKVGVDKLRAIDACTTGGDYVADVLRRRDGFLSATPT